MGEPGRQTVSIEVVHENPAEKIMPTIYLTEALETLAINQANSEADLVSRITAGKKIFPKRVKLFRLRVHFATEKRASEKSSTCPGERSETMEIVASGQWPVGNSDISSLATGN
jgi:hypothetical protein